MISEKAIIEYTKRMGFGLQYAEPGNLLVIQTDRAAPLLVPDDETDEGFISKIVESEKAGENVFSYYYREIDPYPDKESIY